MVARADARSGRVSMVLASVAAPALAAVLCSAPAEAGPAPAPAVPPVRQSTSKPRYVSSQAYYHAMRAELAHLYARGGKRKDALMVLAKAAERSPSSTEPLAEIAQLEVERRDLASAARALESALSRDPRNVLLTGALVAIYERQARYEE